MQYAFQQGRPTISYNLATDRLQGFYLLLKSQLTELFKQAAVESGYKISVDKTGIMSVSKF